MTDTTATQMPLYVTTVAASDRGNVHLSKAKMSNHPATEAHKRIITLEPICGAAAFQKIAYVKGAGPIEDAWDKYTEATILQGPRYREGAVAPWRCDRCWQRGLRLRHPKP